MKVNTFVSRFDNLVRMNHRLAGMALLAAASISGQTPTIYIAGDSTASNVERRGWGDSFGAYFDSSKVTVVNRARAGRSSRTFLTEGLWDKVNADLKPGDFVLLQFGHNDGGPLDTGRARGSLPGLGEETREISMPDGKKELVHTFGWYMRKFIAESRAKGATPVMLSLTVRNIWKDGKVERGSGNFSKWASEIAKAEKTAFVDVTNIAADQYERLGEEKVKALFSTDHTHTSPEGADRNAAAVVAGWKAALPAGLLSEKGTAVAAYRAPIVLPEPANAKLPSLFLIGDSTVRNGRGDGAGGQWGWGDPLGKLFDTDKLNVVNRAVGGLSSRTYFTSRYWETTLALLKPGDFVIMQFGHNDNAPLDDKARARGTIPGIGDESKEVDNPITGQHEVVHTYGWYLQQFIAAAREKGATPMVATLVPRKTWKDGKIVRAGASHAKWAREVAAAEHIGLLDLNELIAQKYDILGAEKVDALFADEHTHTSWAGAELNAAVVVEALSGSPLTEFLKDKK